MREKIDTRAYKRALNRFRAAQSAKASGRPKLVKWAEGVYEERKAEYFRERDARMERALGGM